jgi:hypothetical protein
MFLTVCVCHACTKTSGTRAYCRCRLTTADLLLQTYYCRLTTRNSAPRLRGLPQSCTIVPPHVPLVLVLPTELDLPATPSDYNRWQDTEGMIQVHLAAMDQQLVQVCMQLSDY